jgi:gag-polypeptide of LTR copia-type
MQIPKSLNFVDEKMEEGKWQLKIIDLNELAFTKLVLSIDVSRSAGKIAFSIVKSCKTKECEYGNAGIAWEKLKKKYNPISALSLVKIEIMFRESKLRKDEDPEVWITNLEDLCLQLEVMGSSMTGDQVMVQILNSLTGDY